MTANQSIGRARKNRGLLWAAASSEKVKQAHSERLGWCHWDLGLAQPVPASVPVGLATMAFVGCSPRSGNKASVHLAWSMGPAHTGNVNDITDVTRVLLIQSSPFLPCMAAFDFGKHINGWKSTDRGRKCNPFPCSPRLATLVFLQALKHSNGMAGPLASSTPIVQVLSRAPMSNCQPTSITSKWLRDRAKISSF